MFILLSKVVGTTNFVTKFCLINKVSFNDVYLKKKKNISQWECHKTLFKLPNLKAFTSRVLKILAFSISKSHFITFNISLYNTLNIKTSIFFLQLHLNIISLLLPRPNLFVLFKKSNFLRKHHLLSCLLYKNV